MPELARTRFYDHFFQHPSQTRPGWEGQGARIMDAHRQGLYPYQILRKLLTEWKNIKKQKCTVMASSSAKLAYWVLLRP